MDFYEVLEQVLALLQRHRRVSYRALKRQFNLDDAFIEDLKEELLYSQHPVADEDGRGFVWSGESGKTLEATPQSNQPSEQPTSQEAQPIQAESPPLTEPSTPDAERRQLTVMFSDLVDSTKLSGQLDPEDYREVVRAYQTTCAAAIQRFDGFIAQHLGDALLVYFGFPQAHEDDAQRAIHTGLSMLEAMKTLNTLLEQDKGIRLSIRVGIHTGLTVVGDVGSGQKHELLALGEAPNVASRIQGLAEPDTIAVSDATYRLVEGYFDCDDLGFHTLKGVTEPVQAHRVRQKSGAQSRLEIAATRGLTPLVGRQSEVALLLDRWNQVKDGQGQIVLLSGEGGIGKSRLVQVLKEHLADEPYTRWECRSSPYYQNTALYPITDLFQRTLQWQPEDGTDEKLAKLEQTLSQYRLPLEESVSLFAPLLSLPLPEDRYPPLQWSPQRQRQKTLESIVTILLEQAEQQPVLFIIEDLHWLDPTSLELLDLLLDQAPTSSIYTLLTCRPEFQPPWSSRSYLTQVTLNRLSRTQIERMAEWVAGGKSLPAEVLQQIVEKTDGVPLYVEEMTKAVLESGLLKDINGQYELAGSFSSLAIPATLQDSLMARLDRLMTAKVIAQLGAVIGRQFSYELLQAFSELGETMLQHELNRLVEAELLYQRGLPPQATYVFKHALIQDAAYQSLLKSTRQQYHQRIAQTLEERFPEATEHQPELLAYHCTEAGLNEQAVGYWHTAGQRAMERSANVEAIAHLRKGLEVLTMHPDMPTRIQHELDLQIIFGQALIVTKGQAAPEVGHAYNRARELCQLVEDASQLFRVLHGLWHFHGVRAELQTVRELSEELYTLAQDIQDPSYLLCAHWTLGGALFCLGDFATASEQWKQSIVLYNPQQHHTNTFLFGFDLGMFSLCWSPHALWHLGYPDQAHAMSCKALALARELSHPFSLTVALAYMAMFRQFCREPHTAHECADEVMALCAEQGVAYYLAWGTIIRGWALTEQGWGEEGVAQLRQGLAALQATGGEVRLPYYLALLAEAYGIVGQTEKGLTTVAEALELVHKTGECWYEAELYRLKGKLLLQLSPDNQLEAEACFRHALAISCHQQAKSLELRAATSLSRLQKLQGKRDQARQVLAEVYDWFTEGFDTKDLQDAKALLDELS